MNSPLLEKSMDFVTQGDCLVILQNVSIQKGRQMQFLHLSPFSHDKKSEKFPEPIDNPNTS